MTRKAVGPMLVYIKKDPKLTPVLAKFDSSIVDVLKNSENVALNCSDEIFVKCDVTENGLVLSSASTDHKQRAVLRRPPFCPIRSLTLNPDDNNALDEDVKMRGVHVGVSVLLESADNSIFLTRRAGTMRTFPHVWVPPGGHVERGESLVEAGMRELEEETGIKLEKDSASILGLWESSFPVMRHLGTPKRHHVVVYLHCKHRDTAADINKSINIETKEVDACTWVCSCVTQRIVATDHQFDARSNNEPAQCNSLPETCIKEQDFIDGVVVNSDGELNWGKVIQTAPLFASVGKQKDNERVSTGTKFALKLWMDMIRDM